MFERSRGVEGQPVEQLVDGFLVTVFVADDHRGDHRFCGGRRRWGLRGRREALRCPVNRLHETVLDDGHQGPRRQADAAQLVGQRVLPQAKPRPRAAEPNDL
jgi:hypothetical protein